MPTNNNTLQLLQQQLAKYATLDPRAVEAIASHEGLSGGIGDNGTSFGPFQLHIGGAYPSWAPHGSPTQDNEWAWSPQGLDYALKQIQSVAGGLHGLPAITAISTRFERPANPEAEISDAAAHYGINLPSGYVQGVAVNPSPFGQISNSPSPLSQMASTAPIILNLVNSVLSRNNAMHSTPNNMPSFSTLPLLNLLGGGA